MKKTIILLTLASKVTLAEVLAATTAKTVLVCDFYVEGAERWTAVPWGWEIVVDGRKVINIDHHAPAARFERWISSGNLAMLYVAENGIAGEGVEVVINHTDCDSVISSGIVAGLIDPEEQFGEAVIAADHSGEENPIADLLQALDGRRDLELSHRNLALLLSGEPLEVEVAKALENRRAERSDLAAKVAAGAFQWVGAVAYGEFTGRVAGEFLPALLPGAAVILAASPMRDGRVETKFRLGKAARAGATLHQLAAGTNIQGRWNAGGDGRTLKGDPTLVSQPLAKVAKLIASRL